MTKKNFFTESKTEAESVTDQTSETKLNTAKLKLELIENHIPRDLVESDSMKPRGKKGAGKSDSVLSGIRIDRHIYDKISKQTVSMTLAVNALLQYAIDDLEAKNLKIKILEDEK